MNVSLSSSFAPPFNGPFDIDKCRANIQHLNQTNPELGLTFRLTLAQCLHYCGRGYGPYKVYDALEAITTWVIPLFVLPANMIIAEWSESPFPYAGKIFVVSRQLADPIDTIWSLADKLLLGRRLRRHCDGLDMKALGLSRDDETKAKRDITNVCYCLNDWHDGFGKRVDRIFQLLKGPRKADVLHQIKATSQNLALARVRNIFRTSTAIIVYTGAAFSALLRSNSVGGLGYAQPHTIALRVLCYFLILQVMLSAAAEGWTQQWAPQKYMKRLGKRLDDLDDDKTLQWTSLGKKEILPWQGGIYSFRPSKRLFGSRLLQQEAERGLLFPTEARGSQQLLLLICALLSVWASFSIAFMISWFTPTVGLGGRGVAELVFVALWTLNFVLSQWITSRIQDRKKLFNILWVKDTIIALLLLCSFFLPFIGWYNNCKSWSAYYSWGATGAVLDLNLGEVELKHTWSIYFTGIAGGAAIQGILALTIIGLNYDACKLSQRTDKENREKLCGDREDATFHRIQVTAGKDSTDPLDVGPTLPLQTQEVDEGESRTEPRETSETSLLLPTDVEMSFLNSHQQE